MDAMDMMDVMDRRRFFAGLGRRLASRIADATTGARRFNGELAAGADAGRCGRQAGIADSAPLRDWVRPPGALPDNDAFRTACTRCTDCIEACPYQSIRRLGPEWGADAGTPAIIPAESPCYLCDGLPCTVACGPGALRPTARRDVTMGLARIRYDACYQAQGQPCDYCVARCPLKGEAIRFDGGRRPVVSEENCTGCGVCAYLCPPNAIDIVRQTSARHRPPTGLAGEDAALPSRPYPVAP